MRGTPGWILAMAVLVGCTAGPAPTAVPSPEEPTPPAVVVSAEPASQGSAPAEPAESRGVAMLQPGAEPEVSPELEPETETETESKGVTVGLDPPKAIAVDEPAPDAFRFQLLLVSERIRTRPYAPELADTVAALPDGRAWFGDGGFDVLADFDHVVVASADVRDWTQVVLAASHRMPRDELRDRLEQAATAHGEVIDWVEDGGVVRGNPRPSEPGKTDADPRWFVLLDRDVLVYAREEFLPKILAGPAKRRDSTSGDFVARTVRVRRLAERRAKAGFYLRVDGISTAIANSTLPFAVFESAQMTWSSAKEPKVAVRTDFTNADDAKAFLTWWSEDLKKAIDENFTLKMQLGGLYSALTAKRKGAQVTVSGKFLEMQATFIAKAMADVARKLSRPSSRTSQKAAVGKNHPAPAVADPPAP